MNKCIICVDGGGTKTEVVAFNLQGQEIVKRIGGSGNFSFETEKAVHNVVSTIDEVYQLVKHEYEVSYIQAGISGYGAYINKEQLINDLTSRFNTEVNFGDDAKLALYSILKDLYDEAILILAGTGSACYGIKGMNSLLIGGWGHFLGDEGGAHNLVLRAFKRMVDDEDQGLEPSDFTKKFLKHLNLNTVFDLKKYVYGTSKAEVADHSKYINEWAEEGDLVAKDLLIKSAHDLAHFAYLAHKRLQLSDNVMVGCQGSLILNSKIVNQSFREQIKTYIPQVRLVEDLERPVKGAYYLAIRQLKLKDGELLCTQ